MQPLGTYGTAGRDILTGPNFWNMDVSLLKETPVTERVTLQFRAEAFNLLNHANFQNPQSGIFTSLAGARNANAGRISGTSADPRQMQLALKLLF
jgi:hypothetical protein